MNENNGEKRSIDALMPSDTPDFMAPAWFSCVRWAISNPDILAAFSAETGIRWTPARSGLERAIDRTTGADWRFIEAFVLWVNVNIWGTMAEQAQGGRDD